ncbi:Alpha-1,4-N-acetylgalactosamine transferase PglJ [Lachnospiraceae bacterium TWA4]|nr:Alpha-1,4-N-acetylgalactosamine transferase PglJ [Lachnospiraceae bacterium TWA4]
MKKVLFLIHDLGPGGAEKVLVNLVNNIDPKKFDVTVLTLFGGGVNEKNIKEHVRYKTIFQRMIPGNSKLMKLMTPRQLHHLFIKEKYDIEVSYLEGVSSRIISGCPYKDTKLIAWIHVQQTNKEIASYSFRSYKEAVKCYQRFDKIACVSESVKEDYQQIFPMIKNTSVLYNTNETDEILQLKEEDIEDNLFKESEFKICGVGKLMPIKGFDKLARIHKKLKEKGYPVHSYVLGVGPEKEKIEDYVRENNLQDSFTLLGYQTNPYKYVSKCDVFVCTSTAEGFSTAATEALIVGTPVVTTPVAGMREMLGENNEYGIITEMNEESIYLEIKKLIDSKDLLTHYKDQAKERGKCFSKEITVKAVENYISYE